MKALDGVAHWLARTPIGGIAMKHQRVKMASRSLPRVSHDGTERYGGAKRPALPEPLQGTATDGRPDFDVTHPRDWPQWLLNMDCENASVEVIQCNGKPYVIWWGGTVHDGIWCGPGVWMGGRWRDGIWLAGDWLDGQWHNGEWRGGNFRNGTWWDGVFRGGSFEGLWRGGLWLGGEFNGFRARTTTPPDFTDRRVL